MELVCQNLSNLEQKSFDSDVNNLEAALFSLDQTKDLVLVSSGGTLVSLSRDQHYFIDNFATGLRGAKITESFVKAGFNVVYFHRRGCILPFAEKFELEFVRDNFDLVQSTLDQMRKYSASIILIEFETVFEYLYKLM
jgi:phosphopantothenate-cysteine ligase